MRRYVIDETLGSVDVLCQFDSLGAWPDSHEIRGKFPMCGVYYM